MSKLKCNCCCYEVDGIAFRTTCGHFYCPKCAKQTFQSSSQCSVCSAHLTGSSVKEVTVGIPVFEDTFLNSLFQSVLQNSSWEKINENIQNVQGGYQELVHFTTTQLLFTSSQARRQQGECENTCQLQATQLETMQQRVMELELQKGDIVSSYEQQLRDSDRALVEMQEAYKEKLRKCHAWEKAYNNIRSQLSGAHPPVERSVFTEQDMMQRSEASAANVTLSLEPFSNSKEPRTLAVVTSRDMTRHSLPQGFAMGAAADRAIGFRHGLGGHLPLSHYAEPAWGSADSALQTYQPRLGQMGGGAAPSSSSWSRRSLQPGISSGQHLQANVPDGQHRAIVPSPHAPHYAGSDVTRRSFFDAT